MDIEIITFDIIDSTNIEALKMAKAGSAEGTAILAREQTAGRGRFGRSFASPKDGGVYFSIILRPRLTLDKLPLITLMAGVAVHDALQEIGMNPDIKWVNDVYVNDKKICGILCENTATDQGNAVVVGIGINLLSTNFPPEIADTATSVQNETGNVMTGKELVEILVKYLQFFYGELNEPSNGKSIIDEWKKRSSYYSGKNVKVTTDGETLFGITDGLEPNGALRVRSSDGNISIIQAGDVEQLRST